MKQLFELTKVVLIFAMGIAAGIVAYHSYSLSNSPLGQLDHEIRQALFDLCPPGGSGVKETLYENGAVKEIVYWESGIPARITYFDLDGRELYTSIVDQELKSVNLRLDERGCVIEIFAVKNFEKHGPSFRFLTDQEVPIGIGVFDSARLVSEVEVRGSSRRTND